MVVTQKATVTGYNNIVWFRRKKRLENYRVEQPQTPVTCHTHKQRDYVYCPPRFQGQAKHAVTNVQEWAAVL